MLNGGNMLKLIFLNPPNPRLVHISKLEVYETGFMRIKAEIDPLSSLQNIQNLI